MFIAECYQNIKDTDECPMTNELLETLDQLLDQFNVKHFFTMGYQADIDEDPDVVYSVMYEEKDHATFFLVYALWCKQYRGLTDEKLYKAMLKEGTKHVC